MYDDDCLDYYVSEKIGDLNIGIGVPDRIKHQIVSFCRRDNFQEENFTIDKNIPVLSFYDMYQRNVSSVQLYLWSANLDVIEEYEAFSQNPSNRHINESSLKFYNCSSKHKFGRFCQYSFGFQIPFDHLVESVLTKTHAAPFMTTCYEHLNCTRDEIPWCLDWREICDGKVDCWPIPVDEHNCEMLEDNECGSHEYRCFNGQCIPEIFLSDDIVSPDCIDRSDEVLQQSTLYPRNCNKGDPGMRCTDITYPHWSLSGALCCNPSCGTGSCRTHLVEQYERSLLSYDANTHITEKCWATMICLVQATQRVLSENTSYAHLFDGGCNKVCSESQQSCRAKMVEYCPPLFEFPAKSLGWHHAHFVYSRNQTSSNTMSHMPDYVCYDEQDCSISQPIIYFRKLSQPSVVVACELPNVEIIRGRWISQVAFFRRQVILQCPLKTYRKETRCSAPNQFHCGNRCISKHRLADCYTDCLGETDETYNQSCALNHKHRLTCSSNIAGTLITKCIPSTNIWGGKRDDCRSNIELPHFPTLCDGYIDYKEKINSVMNTDEMNCERWQCDNQYTRCDGIWNCPNGTDEARCFHPVCRGIIGHPCLLRNTTEFICLPLQYSNDGIVHCYGATDELSFCQKQFGEGTNFLCLANNVDDQELAN
ncbi:unnamed protein product, partial [Rotaria sp. Silwood2]